MFRVPQTTTQSPSLLFLSNEDADLCTGLRPLFFHFSYGIREQTCGEPCVGCFVSMKTTRRSERKTQTPYARETKGKKVEAKSRIGQEVARALAYALPLYDMPESAVSGPQPGRPAGIVKRYLVKRPSREEMLKGLWLDQAGPEWAKMRSRNPGTMGSSALDSICGYGKFLGNVDFWAKEAGFVAEEERKDSFPMDHGHYWESSTARLVHIVMGYERAVEVGLIPHAFQAYAHSSPDRICLAGATLAGRFPVLASDSTLVLLEIKNPIFGALTLPSWTPHPHTLIPAYALQVSHVHLPRSHAVSLSLSLGPRSNGYRAQLARSSRTRRGERRRSSNTPCSSTTMVASFADLCTHSHHLGFGLFWGWQMTCLQQRTCRRCSARQKTADWLFRSLWSATLRRAGEQTGLRPCVSCTRGAGLRWACVCVITPPNQARTSALPTY